MFGDKNLPMTSQEIYKQDNLGLKFLNENKKLEVVHINGKHIEYKDEDV